MKGRHFSLRSLFSTNDINNLNSINNITNINDQASTESMKAITDQSTNSPSTDSSSTQSKSPPLSILKKRIASSGEAVELTLGSCSNLSSWNSPMTSNENSPENSPPASAPGSPSQKRKSAQFRDNVDVMYFRKDDTADNTSKGKREQEKLKEVSSRKSRHTSANHLVKCPLHNKHCKEDLVTQFTDVQGNIITNEPHLAGKTIEIITESDSSLRWKITVPIGSGFIRNRTNVKAMTGGKKLIISGFKSAKTAEGEEYLHQYNDKLYLPHAIDAFAVKATMSREGTLKISAPILSSPQSQTIIPSLSKAVIT